MNIIPEFRFTPIGILHCHEKYRYDTPRQAVLADGNEGVIRLFPDHNYEQALQDLQGFDRIWLLFAFHLNTGWKPLVRPPRHSVKKVGLFASRTPHRPNSLGLSCVELIEVSGLEVRIRNFDLLNETPVLDIKPYLPFCDSFPDSSVGWAATADAPYRIKFSDSAGRMSDWLMETGQIDLNRFVRIQLEYEPRDGERKRVVARTAAGPAEFTLAYRTWRLDYRIDDGANEVLIHVIRSGYTPDELADRDDPYEDKELHRLFLKVFP